MTRVLSAHGIGVSLQPGWDVRISLRDQSTIMVPGDERVPLSGYVHPVMHAATIPMAPLVGDYGSHVVPSLGLNDVFIALAEFDREATATPLFQGRFPKLRVGEFDRNALQRALPNRCGTQRFFTANGRAFCLFCVLGGYTRRSSLTAKANSFLAGITIEAT